MTSQSSSSGKDPSPPGPSWAITALKGHKKKVCCVAWNCSGTKLASGSTDGSTRVWNFASATVMPAGSALELKGHAAVTHVEWSPSSPDLLAAYSADRSLSFWATADAASRPATVGLSSKSSFSALHLAWHPANGTVAVVSRTDEVLFVDRRKQKVTHKHFFPDGEVQQVCWVEGGAKLLVCSYTGGVEVYSYPALQHVTSFRGHTNPCYCLAINKEETLMVSGGSDAIVSVWDIAAGCCVASVITTDRSIRRMSMSRDGSFLAVTAEESCISIVDLKQSKLIHQIRRQKAPCEMAVWNPVSDLLAFVGEEQMDSERGRGGYDRHRVDTLQYPVNIFSRGPAHAADHRR